MLSEDRWLYQNYLMLVSFVTHRCPYWKAVNQPFFDSCSSYGFFIDRFKSNWLNSIICSYLEHFKARTWKKKCTSARFLIFQRMEICGFKIKRFLIFLIFSQRKDFIIFSQKKAVLIFQETKTPENFIIFTQKKACLIFQETQTPKKILCISGNKTFLYFEKQKP